MTKAEILNAGAEWLKNNKWGQKSYYNPPCVIGACMLATGLRIKQVEVILGTELSIELIEFNDAKGRTKAQVIRRMRKEAKSD